MKNVSTPCVSGTEDLRFLIDQVLASSTLPLLYARQSYTHVNGFVALTVNETGETCRRIHWWQAAPVDRADIHSHPWSFRSTLLLGRLRLVHYREMPHTTPRSTRLCKYLCASADNQGGYRFDRAGFVNLEPVSDFLIAAGSSYSLERTEIHSVHPIEQSITDVNIERMLSESWLYARTDPSDFNNCYLSPEDYLLQISRLEENLWPTDCKAKGVASVSTESTRSATSTPN